MPINLSELAKARLQEFQKECQKTPGGASLPDAEGFLATLPENEREEVRLELARLRDAFAVRSMETVDVTSPGATIDQVAATEIPDWKLTPSIPSDVDRTTDHVASPETQALPTQQRGMPRNRPALTGFEILGELGRGGMGVVYKARQVKLNRLVALKMVLSGPHADPEQLGRFHAEALAVARLQHPNIVQIYEVGEQDGLPYFCLEFVDGGALDRKVAGKPQPAREAALLVEVLARAMHYAHSLGIIHRDLKPANVLLTSDGIPKIADFGLAKAVEGQDSNQTRSGAIIGTPSFMAPEQARGDVKGVGPLADVYGLGAMLYVLLTGRPPFLGPTMLDTLEQVRSNAPVAPRQLQPKTPVDLETICLKCLEKEPHKRYPSALELANDLRHFLLGEPIQARPVSSTERLVRWCARNPRIAGLSAGVAALLLVVAIGSLAFAYRLSVKNETIRIEKQNAIDAKNLAEANEERANANAREAEKQGKLAITGFYTLVNDFLRDVKGKTGMQELRLRLLGQAEAKTRQRHPE